MGQEKRGEGRSEWNGNRLMLMLPKETFYSFNLQQGYCFMSEDEAQALADELNRLLVERMV